MNYSLPQISRKSLEDLLTVSTASGYSKIELIRNSQDRIYRYKVNAPLENLPALNQNELFDEKYVFFESIGEPVLDIDLYMDFRSDILEIAKKHGFPEMSPNSEKVAFDKELTESIHGIGSKLGITVSNASLEGFWNFIHGLLLIDIVAWRWMEKNSPMFNSERVNRVARGAISNLWWRHNVLTANGMFPYSDWMEKLTQDDIVQIIERPKMRGYYPIVIPFAKKVALIRSGESSDSLPNNESIKKLIRAAAIRLRIYVGSRNIWYMNGCGHNFTDVADSIFLEARRMLA